MAITNSANTDLATAESVARASVPAGLNAPSPSAQPAEQPREVIAIGMGPFNLGLAALAQPVPDVTVTVLEQRDDFAWHPGMLLPDATIQVPFLADLVTFADPTSPYSFLNYLKHTGRLYSFYIRESFYPYRREYSDYCRWVAQQLPGVKYGQRVTGITYDEQGDVFTVTTETATGPQQHTGRYVVLGTGTVPHLPDALAGAGDEHVAAGRVIHTADYMHHRGSFGDCDAVAVVGSGQSAAEVFSDLLDTAPDAQVTWVTRSPRFVPMEVAKLTLEMTSPDYRKYFGDLPEPAQQQANQREQSLYRGISDATISHIYEQLYVRSVVGTPTARLFTGCEVVATDLDPGTGRMELTVRHGESDRTGTIAASRVVAGTGYRHLAHGYTEPIRHLLTGTADARHAIDTLGGRVFAQNTGEQNHGLTSPDLGMGPLRNSEILAAITGRDVYPREKRIAFQEFGVPQ